MSSSSFINLMDACLNVLNMEFSIFGYAVSIMDFVAYGVIATILIRAFYNYFN